MRRRLGQAYSIALAGISAGGAPALARALRALLDGRLSPEEQTTIARIEALRAELEASPDTVEIVDYGALPDGSLDAEQMSAGRLLNESVGERCRSSSIPPAGGLMLFRLVRELRPDACLELGTSLGVSAAYQTAALELNGRGRIVTLEGSESLAVLAREHLSRLGLGRAEVRAGRFQDILSETLRNLGRVDFAFVDGHHDEHATMSYFGQILPSLSDGAVLVFDDISWSSGMRRAWQGIAASSGVALSFTVGRFGVCSIGGSRLAEGP